MPNNSPEVERSLQLLQEGDAAGAVSLLEQATAQSPDDGLAFQYLGVARSQAGDFVGGARALHRAAQLLPDRPSVWFNLGVALSRIGDNDKARIALQNAVTLDPANAKARAALDALPPPASGPVATRYVPAAPAMNIGNGAPPIGRRLLRGLGWGPLWGQWWTLMIVVSSLIFGGGHFDAATVIFYVLAAAVLGIVGAIVGVIIAVANANMKIGSYIGIAAGALLFGLELIVEHGSFVSMLINLYFWYVTGRYIGASIAKRVQAPTAR